MYQHFIKRVLDILLSLLAAFVLAVPLLVIAVLIKKDSPGPVFFRQRRIAIQKGSFYILKFRSMPTTVPHDTPTHQFQAEDLLTPFQKMIRKYSIDELPQIFNILSGSMSIVGPRPALWNQEDLIAERDKYGANEVKPGLTGFAQISGRDELEISEKARLDGEYAEILGKGGWKAFAMDCGCVWRTVVSVVKHDGVVEGGTGTMEKKEDLADVPQEAVYK